jgi:hypothetical protein
MIYKLLLLIVIIFAIYYLNHRYNQYINKKKINIIRTNKIKRIQDDERIVNILFSIQSYYHYNQEAFDELIKNLELFLELYELIKIDHDKSNDLYFNMMDRKKNILNILLSFRIRLPDEYNINDVINDINDILDDYIKKVYDIHEEHIKNNKINYTTKLYKINDYDAYNIDKDPIMPKEKLLFNRI